MRIGKWLMFPAAVAAAVFTLGMGAQAHADARAPRVGSITFGGGVLDFARPQYTARSRLGGAWDVRLHLGTRSPVGFEIGYVGNLRRVAGVDGTQPWLLGTTGVAQARINLTRAAVQPFITGGAGWTYYRRMGNAGEDDRGTQGEQGPPTARTFARSASGLVLPVGGGLTTYINKFVLELRFTYDFAPQTIADRNNARILRGATQRSDDWHGMLRIGYGF